MLAVPVAVVPPAGAAPKVTVGVNVLGYLPRLVTFTLVTLPPAVTVVVAFLITSSPHCALLILLLLLLLLPLLLLSPGPPYSACCWTGQSGTPFGTVTVIDVSLHELTVAETPPIVTPPAARVPFC